MSLLVVLFPLNVHSAVYAGFWASMHWYVAALFLAFSLRAEPRPAGAAASY